MDTVQTRVLTFSIICNTMDREWQLLSLLKSLEKQSYPHFEVIVVVGPTNDNTMQMLEAYKHRLTILRCPVPVLGVSRNIGLRAANGDIVAYIDDDAVPTYHWLKSLAHLFQDDELAATGGRVYAVMEESPIVPTNADFVQFKQGIISSLAEQYDVVEPATESLLPRGKAIHWVPRMMGANMAFRRKSLLQIGGFDEFYRYLYDDTDIAMRLQQAGLKVKTTGQAIVYHLPASNRFRKISKTTRNFNRVWWIKTQASIYFAIRHSRQNHEPLELLQERLNFLTTAHWKLLDVMYEHKQINLSEYLTMKRSEVRGVRTAFQTALLEKPPIMGSEECATLVMTSNPIQPYQNDSSALQPAVDPFTSYSTAIKQIEPPLRLCLTTQYYGPGKYDGIGRLTNLMAQGLFELGHQVHVLHLGERERVSFYDGAFVHYVQMQGERYSPHLQTRGLLNYSHQIEQKVRQLILNDGIQLMDSHNWHFQGLITALKGTLPVAVRIVTGIKALEKLGGTVFDKHEVAMNNYLERLLIENADYVIPNTTETLKGLTEEYGISPDMEKCSIVGYGIIPVAEDQVRYFNPDIAHPSLNVLYVGRMEKRKGIFDLLEAIPLILKAVPEARFTILGGDNSEGDGFYRQYGMTYPQYFASRYPSLQKYVWFIGAADDNALAENYKKCDLFVVPALKESFGLTYLEANNYGKPVIGCRTSGMLDSVQDGVTGVLVEPENPVELSKAVIDLLKSPAKMRMYGEAGRERILRELNYMQMAKNYAEVYRKVIAKRWQND